jgi:hypothetical protein
MPNAMAPDVAEFIEEETGERRESLLLTLLTFAVKVGGSVGVFVVAVLTSLIGYENGQSAQTGGTQLGLALIIGPFQVVLYAIAAWLAWRSPLTRDAFDGVVARLSTGSPAPVAVGGPPTGVRAADGEGGPVDEAAVDEAAVDEAAVDEAAGAAVVPAQAGPPDRLASLARRTGMSPGQLQTVVVGVAVAGLLAATGLPPVLRGGGEIRLAEEAQASAPLAAPGGGSVLAPAAPPQDVPAPVLAPFEPADPARVRRRTGPAGVALAPSEPLPPATPVEAPPTRAAAAEQEAPGGPPVLAGALSLAETAWFGAAGPDVPDGACP